MKQQSITQRTGQLHAIVLVKSPRMKLEVQFSLGGSGHAVLKENRPGKWKAIQKILLYLFRFSVPLIVHWIIQ
jgi:hypothetical protein